MKRTYRENAYTSSERPFKKSSRRGGDAWRNTYSRDLAGSLVLREEEKVRSSSCVSRISVKGDSQFPIIKSFLWYGNDSEPHFTEITPYDTYLVRDSPETVDSSRCNKSDSHGAFALLTKNLLVPTVVWNSRYTFRLYCITFCVVKKRVQIR